MGIVNCGLSPLDTALTPRYFKPEVLKQVGQGEIEHAVPWKTLSEEQKRFQATKMAIHAAMIDRMDREIGHVLDQLRTMDAFDDTLIIFLSDNGADATLIVRGDGHDRGAEPGSWRSFLCIGPGWASASNAPFRRHKIWVHEGGIATPLILHWPMRIAARGTAPRPGTRDRLRSHDLGCSANEAHQRLERRSGSRFARPEPGPRICPGWEHPPRRPVLPS